MRSQNIHRNLSFHIRKRATKNGVAPHARTRWHRSHQMNPVARAASASDPGTGQGKTTTRLLYQVILTRIVKHGYLDQHWTLLVDRSGIHGVFRLRNTFSWNRYLTLLSR